MGLLDSARDGLTRAKAIIADLSVYRAEILSVIGQPACDDGIDEDGDGLVDHPEDPGCTSATDDDERDPNLVCDDGLDNDGDGFTDYGQDFGCASPDGGSEVDFPPECGDGVDNDEDGDVDFPDDTGCWSGNDTTEFPALQCQDGIDNDGDGRFNEDGVGGLDINRNWPGQWQHCTYPMSEIDEGEAFAAADDLRRRAALWLLILVAAIRTAIISSRPPCRPWRRGWCVRPLCVEVEPD